MPHSSPSFIKTVIKHFQHVPKSIPHSLNKPFSRTKIYRWFKKLDDGVNDASSKCLRRRMGLEVVGEFPIRKVSEKLRALTPAR